MKKLFLSIVLLFILSGSFACPICGCGVGGFYIGLLPTYKSQFIGVRYQYSHYETHLNADPTQYSHDFYRTVELYGGITIGSKWQVLGFLPYHLNYQNTDDGIIKRNGLGDISMSTNYKIWNTSGLTKNNKSFSHEFWLGAGVKLPTGKYNVDYGIYVSEELDNLLGNVNSQMGTGTVDFIANAMYNVQINKFGINTTVNYKINQPMAAALNMVTVFLPTCLVITRQNLRKKFLWRQISGCYMNIFRRIILITARWNKQVVMHHSHLPVLT